jgi:hypothetical protein
MKEGTESISITKSKIKEDSRKAEQEVIATVILRNLAIYNQHT